jgi:hypothetical protein
MAKKKEVIITCNATNVKAVIEGLERGMAALAKEEEKLLKTIKKRGYAEDDEKKRLKELEKAMDAMRTNVQKNRDEQKKLAEVMKDLAGSKLKDLKKALQEGKAALNNMSERDPKRKQLVDDLQRIQRQIDKNTGATNKLNTANKGLSATLATTAKNLATYMIGFAGFNKVKSLIEDVFKANIKLSDSLANIRKVSGLSGEAINQLYRNLSQIDTRNTIEMLNQLAYTGAKLGIGQNYGVEGLTGFVKAAEQVQMALGEDMGEKALPELSKMVEVMGLIPKYGVEQAMQKAASAIFQLGATSTATGSNIVEFSKRLMGLANVSRISTQDLLALGSASDAMGLMPEVSATAFNKLFTSIQRQHNLIEDSLGLTKGTIKSLYDEGKTMDAIVMIFEKMNEKGNLNLLGSIFKDLGSDGARLVNVMATMADRADILRKHLETSRNAFKEGEAVIGEYMIQNQTAAALVERASNLWAKAFTNPEGVDMVKEMAQAWYDLSKQMTQSEALMGSLHTSINAIASAIGALIKLFPVLIRFAMIFGTTLGFKGLIAGIGGMITAFRTLYKDIVMATGAMGAFNVVMKSNAVLFAVSALITAITLVNDYSKAAEEAAKREQERQAKLKAAFENSKEAVEKVVKPLEIYKKALDDATLSEKQRLELVKQFKTDYQDYLDYLGIEINSAVDLAKAYAQVVKVMKQKKAYEEREEYRTQQNGENRMSRIENQAKVEAAARSFGIEGIDKKWLEETQNVKGNGVITSRGTADVYRELIEKKMGVSGGRLVGDELYFKYVDDKLVSNDTRTGPRDKVRYKKVGSKELYDAIDNYIASFRAERDTNKQINQMFNTEYKDIDLEHFDIDEFNDRVQRAKWERKGSLENEAPDKEAIKAAKKAAQEAKEAMRKEMQDAQKESTGVLSKLEEWYRLQEAAITEARADGKMTEEQAAQMVNTLNIIKNESLATARRAITTGDTKAWDELKTNIMPKAMADASDLSKNLLETIQNVPVQVLHDNLAKFNGDAEKVFGHDSRAFFDQINAKAAGNTREAARLRAKLFKQAEKLLEQYEIVRVAQKKMQTDLEGIGIVTETYEEFAYRMQNGITEKQPKQLKNGKTITDEEAYAQMGAKFIGQGTLPYRINIENADEALQWIQQFATNAKGELEDWAQAFPDIENWVTLLQRKNELMKEGRELTEAETEELAKIPEKLAEAIPTIKAMFYQLEQSASSVADTIKKQVDAMMVGRAPIGIDEMGEQHNKRMRLTEEEWDKKINDARSKGDENAALDLEKQKKQQLIDLEYQFQEELWQIREKMGATEWEQYQHEVAMYKNMLDKKLISEKQFQQKKGQLQMKLGLNVAQQYNTMMSDMVNALQEAEIASVEAKYDAEIQAAQANGQDTAALEEQKEAEIMEIRKKYAGMQFAIKISEIIANTAVAIMQAYAQLGPIAGSVAAAMLTVTGAAQIALAKAEYDKVMGMQVGGSKATSSSSNTKTKIVSGMLTYDKGNVQRFIGQDGKVYTATEEPAPKDGLVKHPIATTVQGQSALVAENGPEIVIGRETTRAIQMNEPELIRYLATYQQHGGAGYRTYDSGNTSEITPDDMTSSRNNDILGGTTLNALAQVVAELSFTVQELQKNGVPAYINKYGAGGLIDEVKSGLKFDAKYNVQH